MNELEYLILLVKIDQVSIVRCLFIFLHEPFFLVFVTIDILNSLFLFRKFKNTDETTQMTSLFTETEFY